MPNFYRSEVDHKRNALILEERYKNVVRKGVDRTIALDNSMSASDIQDLIDAQLKYIPYGKTLTFQFEDGTYTLNNEIKFTGFFGGGTLDILGNSSDSGLGTSKSVSLNPSATQTNCIEILGNSVALIRFRYCKVTFDSPNGYSGCYLFGNSSYIQIGDSYFLGAGIGDGYGVYAYRNTSYINCYNNYVSWMLAGFRFGQTNPCMVNNCDDTGTQPGYGVYVQQSQAHALGTQPSGSTANTIVIDGEIYS